MSAECRMTKAEVKLEVTLVLGEEEARALNAMTQYGAEAFLRCLSQGLSQAMVHSHGTGFRSFYDAVLSIGPMLDRARAARDAFKNVSKPNG